MDAAPPQTSTPRPGSRGLRWSGASFVLLLLGLVLCWPARVASGAHEVRTWTSNDGKTLQAQLVSASGGNVVLKLRDGNEVTLPLTRLSPEDQALIKDLESQGLAIRAVELPAESSIELPVPIIGGPTVFESPHFEIEASGKVSKAFISEAAMLFEGTLAAVEALPLGLNPVPPGGEGGHFRTRLMDRAEFEAELKKTAPDLDASQVAGVYFTEPRVILVPYESIGAQELGSQLTLRKSSDLTTLIHEITHQVMHDWLILLPVWTAEGMAEYMAAVPYQNGRFEFRNAETGLKARLELRYDYDPKTSQPMDLIHPADFFYMRNADWEGSKLAYQSALLWMYYFIHLDRGGGGNSAAAYLQLLGNAKNETDRYIAEYNAAVEDYRKRIEAFKVEVDNYNAAVRAYNRKISELNEGIRSGKIKNPSSLKSLLGEPPKQPVEPEIPELLKNAEPQEGPIDLFAVVNNKARPALVRNRSDDEIIADVKQRFEAIGIPIRVLEPRAPKPVPPAAAKGGAAP